MLNNLRQVKKNSKEFKRSKPCKPGSVLYKKASIIYLGLSLRIGSINLPIVNSDKSEEDEQPSSFTTYLVFQHTRFTVIYVTIQYRELLPHAFTLTIYMAVYFLLHFLSAFKKTAFPLGSVSLFVARTFLSSKIRTAIESVCF